jgi:hypothetical protein
MWKRTFSGARTDHPGRQMNGQRTTKATHAFRLPPLKVALAALALPLLALVAPVGAHPGDDLRPPELGDCQDLQVPVGNEVTFHAFGVGVQVYRWNGTSWIFAAPQAVLFADAGGDGIVGIHFGGPTWEGVDGSKVVGTVIESCTPDPDAIPWLLLGAASTEGPGIFDRVTYLQRLNTVGGKAPTHPGDFPGEVARVPYSADYFFYRADH